MLDVTQTQMTQLLPGAFPALVPLQPATLGLLGLQRLRSAPTVMHLTKAPSHQEPAMVPSHQRMSYPVGGRFPVHPHAA